MGSRTWLNVVLLLAVAALIAVAWWQPAQPPAPEQPPLTNLDPDTIQEIRVQPRQASTVHLARSSEGRWVMRAPYTVHAARGEVQRLLGLAEAPSLSGFRPKPGADLEPYGLAEPEVRVLLDDTPIDLGGTEPISRRRYVRVGDTIHLVEDRYRTLVNAAPTQLVSRRLLPAGRQPVTINSDEWALTREAQGWRLSPAPQGAPPDAAATMARSWTEARALEVRPAGDAPARGRVDVAFDGAGAPVTFHVVRRQREWILRRSDLGLDYGISPATAKGLLEPPAAKRDTATPPPADAVAPAGVPKSP